MSSRSAPVDVQRFVRLTDVSLDEAYTLLANVRLRIALHVLSACETPVSVDWLSETLARWDDDSPESIEIELVHTVLPKLEDFGILEYDARSGIVRMDDPVVAFDHPRAESLLAPVDDTRDSTVSTRSDYAY
ncbi:DUF7344 domain-containing protein [Natrialba asiatica]|uniref:DUF7344 domain-containing protein n=1 Tax=Natrialba asiatica (strain ATCC 700177 / DSM 12278 / JCM 9576 / FERM P-10747 / NBRC 102637 / 172P1) TaxID=29540 RepID=M0AYH3_NATA1|nr:hypothetical protein [Natrialba asiatica]ELZ03377.1 hypothetical protein C481_05260 [Natrialba asiatica DSM 12278]